jgi:hypothetical protein
MVATMMMTIVMGMAHLRSGRGGVVRRRISFLVRLRENGRRKRQRGYERKTPDKRRHGRLLAWMSNGQRDDATIVPPKSLVSSAVVAAQHAFRDGGL